MTGLSRTAVVVAAQRRFRARRRAGSRRIMRLVVAGTVALVVLGVGGWLIATSSLFGLRFVTVEGTSRLTAAQVLTAADVHEGTSLFRVDAAAIGRRVARLRPVAAAHVTRHWPHGIVIEVTERTPVGVVTGGSRAVLLDADGVAFADVAKPPPGLVHVAVAAPVPGDGSAAARAAMRVLAELPAGVRGQVSAVSAPTPDAVRLRLANGRRVVWGSPDAGATKAAVLRTLLRRSAQVYDVSTPSVAVTRG